MKRAIFERGKPHKEIDIPANEVAEKEVLALSQPTAEEKSWKTEMVTSDITMLPRYVEDIIDALPVEIRENIHVNTLEKYNAKKALREKKPK